MPKAITLVLPGAPRTKKTSNRAITVKGKAKVLPSEAFTEWLKSVMVFRPLVHAQLRMAGVRLPLEGPVQMDATFYRAQNSGDTTGFYQALADAIQDRTWSCSACRKIVHDDAVAGHRCAGGNLKRKRDGLGLIRDDSQIVHWDGSRLQVDRDNPRIELEIKPAYLAAECLPSSRRSQFSVWACEYMP